MAEQSPLVPVKLKGVISSNIESIGYDPAAKHLYIKFRRAETIYRYEEVSKDLWEEFEVAESHGKFLHTRIRPHFTGTKVQEDEPLAEEAPAEAPAQEEEPFAEQAEEAPPEQPQTGDDAEGEEPTD